MVKADIALQLYSVRDEMKKSVHDTLAAVKKMGYDSVETAGLEGLDFKTFKAELDECGLSAISAHVSAKEVFDNPAATAENYKGLGCKYLTVPNLPDELKPGNPGFEQLIVSMKNAGEIIKKSGITFLYHNHYFEFVRMPDGTYALDYLFKNVSLDLLKPQFDVCWVTYAGESPIAYIDRYAPYIDTIHLKDSNGKRRTEEDFAFTALGSGVVDIKGVVEAGIRANAKCFIVEQDSWAEYSSMEYAEKSITYLKTL